MATTGKKRGPKGSAVSRRATPGGVAKHHQLIAAEASLAEQIKAAAERGIRVSVDNVEIESQPTDGQPGKSIIRFRVHQDFLTPTNTGSPSPAFDPWSATAFDDAAAYGVGSPEFAACCAAGLLNAWRPNIEERAGVNVLRAMAVALSYGLVTPDWLVEAFRQCMLRLDRFDVCGLDEAFKNSPLTDRTRKTLQRHKDLFEKVSNALRCAIDADPDRAIDIHLHEDVGAQLGIGKTVCSELYKEGLARGYPDLVEHKQRALTARSAKRESSGQ